MSNRLKVVVSAILVAVLVSLLWLVIPITPVWIISYIFAIIAILGMSISFIAYTKKTTSIPQGHSFPIAAITYAVVSTILSTVTVFFDYGGISFPSIWYAIIHVAIFVFYVIRIIMLLSGSEHIDKVGEHAEQKHKELNKDKADYWK